MKHTRYARIGYIKTVGQVGQVGHEDVKRNKINGSTIFKNGPLALIAWDINKKSGTIYLGKR